jgi:hypothetical protein
MGMSNYFKADGMDYNSQIYFSRTSPGLFAMAFHLHDRGAGGLGLNLTRKIMAETQAKECNVINKQHSETDTSSPLIASTNPMIPFSLAETIPFLFPSISSFVVHPMGETGTTY